MFNSIKLFMSNTFWFQEKALVGVDGAGGENTGAWNGTRSRSRRHHLCPVVSRDGGVATSMRGHYFADLSQVGVPYLARTQILFIL